MERKKLLEKEWSPKNSKGLSEYREGTHFKALWEHYCECGEKHEWGAIVRDRFAGNNCPHCCGKRGRICFCKSLEALRPDLASEWSFKNQDSPGSFSIKSSFEAFWEHDCQCGKKHEWQAQISARIKGNNCPHCSGKGRVPPCRCKSLGALRPDLLLEWSELNKVSPFELSPQSTFKAVWEHICDCGKTHTWTASVQKRFKRNDGCAQCSGKGRILICPCKSLANLRPDLLLEWHPKNPISPFVYSPSANTKVRWKCTEKGHKWSATINYRTNQDSNCPFCKTPSKGEKLIKDILNRKDVKYLPQKRISFKECTRLRFDFYLPDYKTAIEFDGRQHFFPVKHFGGEEEFKKRKKFDSYKNDYCIENGILLLRIHYKDKREIDGLVDFILVEDSPIDRVFSSNYP